jgi:hypothetical protein
MTIKTAKIALTALWGVCAIPLLLVLVLRQLNGFYGDQAQAAWSWAAQFVFPNLTLIGGAWSVAGSPEDDKPLGSAIVFWGCDDRFRFLYRHPLYRTGRASERIAAGESRAIRPIPWSNTGACRGVDGKIFHRSQTLSNKFVRAGCK